MDPQWLSWAKQLQAIAQSGLAYGKDPYDIERYQALRDIALDIMARGGDFDLNELKDIFQDEIGYCTPKIDVRGAAFKDDKVLLVQEIGDNYRWTLPGGWGDIGLTARENAEKEFLEESGYQVRATKLVAVYDRAKQGHAPPHPHDCYKLFFLCEIIGGSPQSSIETSAVDFFALDNLPELSLNRVTAAQLETMYAHYRNPQLATEFD